MIVADSKITAFHSTLKPWLAGRVCQPLHRNRTAKNVSVGFYGTQVCISSELFEKVCAERAALVPISIDSSNKIGQGNQDLAGTLKRLFFFMGTELSELQDVSLNPGYRASFLLASGVHNRSPDGDYGDKNKKQQANAQRFKKKKLHGIKSSMRLSQ
jgi:hypothetical protein